MVGTQAPISTAAMICCVVPPGLSFRCFLHTPSWYLLHSNLERFLLLVRSLVCSLAQGGGARARKAKKAKTTKAKSSRKEKHGAGVLAELDPENLHDLDTYVTIGARLRGDCYLCYTLVWCTQGLVLYTTLFIWLAAALLYTDTVRQPQLRRVRWSWRGERAALEITKSYGSSVHEIRLKSRCHRIIF